MIDFVTCTHAARSLSGSTHVVSIMITALAAVCKCISSFLSYMPGTN